MTSSLAMRCVHASEAAPSARCSSVLYTQRVASDAAKAYLRTLDDQFVLHAPGGDILAVHGSPRRINEYLFEDRPASAMERMARDYQYPAILFGHTHVPYARRVGGAVFVNVGSAGRPKDGDWRVCYALVDPARLGEREGFVELVRVPYDHERLLADMATTPLITSFSAPSGPHEG